MTLSPTLLTDYQLGSSLWVEETQKTEVEGGRGKGGGQDLIWPLTQCPYRKWTTTNTSHIPQLPSLLALTICEKDLHQVFQRQNPRRPQAQLVCVCLYCEVPDILKQSMIIPAPKKSTIPGLNYYRAVVLMYATWKTSQAPCWKLRSVDNAVNKELHYILQHLDSRPNSPSSLCLPPPVSGSQTYWLTGSSKWGWEKSHPAHGQLSQVRRRDVCSSHCFSPSTQITASPVTRLSEIAITIIGLVWNSDKSAYIQEFEWLEL